MADADFLFALCNPGSELAIKTEVGVMGLPWKSSYQRRGFISFKLEEGIQENSLVQEIACARRICRSIGKYDSQEAATEALSGAKVIHHARYHLKKMEGIPCNNVDPNFGDEIGTVVQLGETEFWAGVHHHSLGLSPDPAGDGGIELPKSAPSRAWLKLEEAVRFWGLEFTAGQIAVELGCSPGGVVHALLDRGVSVIGVDPAKMADIINEKAVERRAELNMQNGFYHCRKPAALVGKRDLGEGLTWFLSDMNQNPEVTLKECARIVGMSPSIYGVLITLKLREMEAVERKEKWIQSLHHLGFTTVRLQQLSVNHREISLLGLR